MPAVLGFLEGACTAYGIFDNRFGGHPVVPQPSLCWFQERVACRSCGGVCTFLCQLDCPTEGHSNRVLFVFVCNRSACSKGGGWRVFRCICPEDFLEGAPAGAPLQWARFPEQFAPARLLATRAESLPPGFEALSVSAEHLETCRRLLEQCERDDPEAIADVLATADNTADAAFAAYEATIAANAQQVLRYDRGGVPLPVVADEQRKEVRGRCSACGAALCFELQLVPTLISLLGCSTDSEMDWLSLEVFTCAADCASRNAGGYSLTEEHAVAYA